MSSERSHLLVKLVEFVLKSSFLSRGVVAILRVIRHHRWRLQDDL